MSKQEVEEIIRKARKLHSAMAKEFKSECNCPAAANKKINRVVGLMQQQTKLLMSLAREFWWR